jgi:hypothetical protein
MATGEWGKYGDVLWQLNEYGACKQALQNELKFGATVDHIKEIQDNIDAVDEKLGIKKSK